MNFNERLRLARRAQLMTQAKLGELAELSESAICNYENNRCLPGIKTLPRLAKALDVTPAWLLGDMHEDR